ncbi:MAG: biotin/lipoyl-binding protein [Bacilli bacterium]|nr:biotin/lipoyl-binding protein [Bacilli bacterium]
MKVYKVKVNGKVYEVELESISLDDKHIEASAPQPSGAGVELNAPMAGSILEVKVKVGDMVKEGDVICILEAMKLENEVVANASGVVKDLKVSKGTTVQNGQLIAIIG